MIDILGEDKQFIEIVKTGKKENPHYHIKYLDRVTGKTHKGYSSYRLEVISQFLREDFIEQARWIPVSERLPEENGIYIVSYEDSVRLLEWFNGKWFFYPSNPAREETGTIIAWQLLPQPYKAESEE